MDKPAEMFDRDHEWSALSRFITDPQPGATLGVVSGRRRQGKTFLLDAACRATGGFYFGATEAADAESLRRISAALTAHVRPASPFHFADWTEAVDALLALGAERPVPVVIDEFPYLAKANPELPSIIQEALRPLRDQRTGSRTRLLLCGSALSFMGRLLSGNAPLRGRSGLELVVRPLDHRLAAEFWDITDLHLAMKVNAIVGGTPAYRREFARGDTPKGPDDFDDWVVRTVLNPETPLFREARICWPKNPTFATPPCTCPFWPLSPTATPPAGAWPATWNGRPQTSPIPSTSSKTQVCCTGTRTSSATTVPPTASPNR